MALSLIAFSDEILFNARLHPEQYSDTFNANQTNALHTSIVEVCSIAVSNLADSSQFPQNWLFNYRWGKGKKDSPATLPSGEKLAFLTVGGRTSCIVPSLQKKTGVVAGDVRAKDSGGEEDDGEGVKEEKQNRNKKKNAEKEKGVGKRKLVKEEDEEDQEVDEDEEEEEKPKKKQRKSKGKSKTKDEEEQAEEIPETKENVNESEKPGKKQKLVPAPRAEKKLEEQTPKTKKSNGTAEGAKKQKKADDGAKDTEVVVAPTGNRKSRRAALK